MIRLGPAKDRSHAKGLRIVALFEGTKGLLVLLVGFQVLRFVHQDIHEAAVHLVKHLHLNPAGHYPHIFLDLSERVSDANLWSVAIGAATYSAVRIIEAVGLWLRKSWAEWFAVLTGGMYIPLELLEVFRKASWPRVTVLVVNVAIVLYLLAVLFLNDRRPFAKRP